MQKFIDKMDPSTVQIGLETFALSVSPYPTPYQDVTTDFPALKSDLRNLTTLSGSNSLDMLPSIMRSINEPE